jgi:hypothetical protein
MQTWLLAVVDVLPTAGGRIVVGLTLFLVGMAATAFRLDIGHDVTMAALGILIALLHRARIVRKRSAAGVKTPS